MSFQNLKIFFRPDYLFTPYPGYGMKFFPYFLIFFVVLLILAVISHLQWRRNKKLPSAVLWSQIYNWLFWISWVGLLLIFFRDQGIPYVSMRFLLFFWLLVFGGWGVYIGWFYRKRYPKIFAEYKKKKEKEKYLRRRKS